MRFLQLFSYLFSFLTLVLSLLLLMLLSLRKHAYIILTPLKPHFYIVKWGLQEYTLFFLFLLKNIDCGYSLEPPRRGGSNEYPQSMFFSRNEKYKNFLSENFHFLVIKFSVYLNRHVFVMLHLLTLSQILYLK